MTTLSPSSRGRGGRRTGPVTLVLLLVLALAAAAVAGYVFFLRDSDSPAAVACPSPSSAPSPSATEALPAPATIAVRVLNTTNRSGLAKTVADELTTRGFAVGEVTNAEPGTVVAGVAEVRYAAQGEASAKVVAAQVGTPALPADPAASPAPSAAPPAEGAPTEIPLVGTGAPGAGVDLLLGQGFATLLDVTAAADLLAPPAPVVATPAGCVEN